MAAAHSPSSTIPFDSLAGCFPLFAPVTCSLMQLLLLLPALCHLLGVVMHISVPSSSLLEASEHCTSHYNITVHNIQHHSTLQYSSLISKILFVSSFCRPGHLKKTTQRPSNTLDCSLKWGKKSGNSCSKVHFSFSFKILFVLGRYCTQYFTNGTACKRYILS